IESSGTAIKSIDLWPSKDRLHIMDTDIATIEDSAYPRDLIKLHPCNWIKWLIWISTRLFTAFKITRSIGQAIAHPSISDHIAHLTFTQKVLLFRPQGLCKIDICHWYTVAVARNRALLAVRSHQ